MYSEPCRSAIAQQKRGRVFVVEDDALSAIMLGDLLDAWGFEICGMARSAPAAVKDIEVESPDFVLMDIRLADNTDGIAAALEIRARLGIHCIFLSAHDDPQTLARVREAEPLGFLSKPYSPGMLEETIDRAVKRLQSSDSAESYRIDSTHW